MTETIYYYKEGKKYKPVSYYDSNVMDGFPEGTHLVVVQPGVSSRRYNIKPDLAPVIAATVYAKTKLCDALQKGSEVRPQNHLPLTAEQQLAIDNLKQAFDCDRYYLQYPSINDAVECFLDEVQHEAEKLLTNPTLKKAYENFMLLAKLAYENNEI